MKAFLLLLAVSLCLYASAQKKIVILGSSTAEGFGASPHFPYPPDSSWVGLLRLAYNKNTSDGIDTTVINLAVGGFTTYHVMPDNYTPPPNRPNPVVDNNVTKALSHNPDAIVINLPSNDISTGYNKTEIMQNFRLMFQAIMNAGVKAYITTTHPRNFLPNTVMMEYQRDLRDSILTVFGQYGINTWDDLVSTSPPNLLRPEVDYGDGYHVNNLGHRLIFQRVMEKNILQNSAVLPVLIKTFTVKRINNAVVAAWETLHEEPGTYYELERSTNGQTFTPIALVQGGAVNYQHTDPSPANGKLYYRLKIHESGSTKFSNTVFLQATASSLVKVFRQTPSALIISISPATADPVIIQIISSSGAVVKQLLTKDAEISIPISGLAQGQYFLNIRSGSEHYTRAFKK